MLMSSSKVLRLYCNKSGFGHASWNCIYRYILVARIKWVIMLPPLSSCALHRVQADRHLALCLSKLVFCQPYLENRNGMQWFMRNNACILRTKSRPPGNAVIHTFVLNMLKEGLDRSDFTMSASYES